ncbi:MAG: ATP-dependent DNA helicase RecQ [Deltaproteobacteria bacterium]|nr:MAG: ATP-dependent DNA helicase RecQ [Deltaproteobacteria bacterium]
MRSAPPRVDELRQVARQRFGIARLHREQERTIGAVLSGRDVLLVLPTGGGKSLCYQLPSLLLPRPTVVVSPLLALLEDQFLKLQQLGVPTVRLDSTVGVADRRAALARIAAGGSILVLTTPETLSGDELGALLAKSPPGLVAVDEAHCISEWGHDFRPAYLALGQRLAGLRAGQILALTATATPPVRDDIVRYLGLREPEIIVASPHRHNLMFSVRDLRGDEKLRHLAKLARRLPRPGIVYCSTTKMVDDVWLGLRLIKVPCARYHGKMTDKERSEHQARFMKKGKRIVMVATSAFGLGIDKPDIRYIVHYQAPASLERYLQEAGRAGRDGHAARCMLLFDESDLQIQEHLLALSRLSPSLLGRFGRALAAWAGEERDANIEELALSAGVSQRAASSLVTTLVEAGICERVENRRVHATGPLDTLVERVEGRRGRFEVLRREDARRMRAVVEYASEPECRSVALRRYNPPNTRRARCARLPRPPRHRLRFLRPLRSPRSTRRRTIWLRSWVLPGCHRSRRRPRSPGGLRDPCSREARRATAAAGAVDGDAGTGPDPPSRSRPAHRSVGSRVADRFGGRETGRSPRRPEPGQHGESGGQNCRHDREASGQEEDGRAEPFGERVQPLDGDRSGAEPEPASKEPERRGLEHQLRHHLAPGGPHHPPETDLPPALDDCREHRVGDRERGDHESDEGAAHHDAGEKRERAVDLSGGVRGRQHGEIGESLPDAFGHRLRVLTLRPEYRGCGRDGEHIRCAGEHEPAEEGLPLDEETLGDRERHEDEAVRPRQRRLEDADHAEALAPDGEIATRLRAEVASDLAAEHDLVAPGIGNELAAPRARRRRATVQPEGPHVHSEDERGDREGQRRGRVRDREHDDRRGRGDAGHVVERRQLAWGPGL